MPTSPARRSTLHLVGARRRPPGRSALAAAAEGSGLALLTLAGVALGTALTALGILLLVVGAPLLAPVAALLATRPWRRGAARRRRAIRIVWPPPRPAAGAPPRRDPPRPPGPRAHPTGSAA